MRATDFDQNPKPLLIGERVNAQGSRKVKRLLLAEDYEGISDVAREQVESGAHLLDVCVAVTERGDEAEQMAKVVKLLSMTVDTPIMIDSTEAPVIERALEAIPGRAVINSINMENGRERIDRVVPLAKKHGAALVALTIDPIGMAKTRERKLEVAKKIYEIVVGEYGLKPEDLIYDDLTFTLATGDAEWIDSAVETIEGIRLIKRELPGVYTSLGVSNVSFGLAPEARSVLNSVFLHHCVEAGLDMAIVNPAHVQPYAEISADERALADDLVFNRRPDALQRFIEHFDKTGTREAAGDEKVDPTAGMTADQKVHWMVVHRKKDGIETALDAAGVREAPVRVLNEVLLPAMKEVGDKFGAGELILPFVLQSAEVMKKAVKHLEGFLERAEGYTKGKVVLATVYGDVHDIGKSLVNTILSNNGYTVFDLGKQVPVNTIIDKAIEVGADAIGLSALLVSTSKQMPLCVQELDRRGMKIPVLDWRRGDQSPLRTARAVRRRRARVRSGRVLLQGRVRGTRDRRPSARQRHARVVHGEADGRRAQRQVPQHERRQGHVVGDRRRSAQRRLRGQSGAVRAVFWVAHADGHSARRSLFAARPRRAVSIAVGRSRFRAGIRGDGQERVRADARATQGIRETRRVAPSEGRVRLLPGAGSRQRPRDL